MEVYPINGDFFISSLDQLSHIFPQLPDDRVPLVLQQLKPALDSPYQPLTAMKQYITETKPTWTTGFWSQKQRLVTILKPCANQTGCQTWPKLSCTSRAVSVSDFYWQRILWQGKASSETKASMLSNYSQEKSVIGDNKAGMCTNVNFSWWKLEQQEEEELTVELEAHHFHGRSYI